MAKLHKNKGFIAHSKTPLKLLLSKKILAPTFPGGWVRTPICSKLSVGLFFVLFFSLCRTGWCSETWLPILRTIFCMSLLQELRKRKSIEEDSSRSFENDFSSDSDSELEGFNESSDENPLQDWNGDFNISRIEADDGPYLYSVLSDFLGNTPFDVANCVRYLVTCHERIGGMLRV